MSEQFTAARSALGYYYQTRYALLLLLKAPPNSEMSLESFDDVTFEKNGKPKELIQAKHRINGTASLSDSSTDLWKTLRIWSSAITKNEINPKETMFTLVTTARAADGSAASKLRPTNTRDEHGALNILINTAETSTNKENKKAYSAFMDLDKRKQNELLKNTRILDSSPQIEDVKNEILEKLKMSVLEKFENQFFTRLEGWWFNVVINHLSGESKNPILFNELRAKIIDLGRQFDDDNLPIDFLDMIIPFEDLSEAQRIFIEQLRLVSVSKPRIKRAISDYYRAYTQRSKWTREDLLSVGDLGKYEKRLVDEWEELFYIMKEDLDEMPINDSAVEKGKALYNCISRDSRILIRPKVTEPYVTRGSYHMLSNKLKIGWHVDFFNRLQRLNPKEIK